MKRIYVRCIIPVVAGACLPAFSAAAGPPQAGTYVTIPEVIEGPDGRSQSAERGLFFVPENRLKPDSRIIPIHFLRFRAADHEPGRAPVFLLPGGPGSDWNFSKAENFQAAERLRRTRDVVYVSQRGNPYAPNLVPDLYVSEGPGPLDEPGTAERDRQAIRKAVSRAQDAWTERGVDLSGGTNLRASSQCAAAQASSAIAQAATKPAMPVAVKVAIAAPAARVAGSAASASVARS